jgi:hypothetical protein
MDLSVKTARFFLPPIFEPPSSSCRSDSSLARTAPMCCKCVEVNIRYHAKLTLFQKAIEDELVSKGYSDSAGAPASLFLFHGS